VNRLLSILSRVRGAGDVLFALGVLAVLLLLVAPLPPALLDACLALNLALSATILVVTLFARDALRFASFPTLLLLTTLFRLALNVSSTRLILSRGEAGGVIEAFGRVVVQGNYVVGAVVFAILTLVQLLVVARGAERVAEVAARFTLDALPGKQMAIDADLRGGLLDPAEARRRRRALERESQLYGSMDGALKFVKGDAIAGIAIVLVNVLGGLVSGAIRGLSLPEAAARYTVLAIGDGLVSQIPALLIAVSAGVAVTRVAAEEEGASLAAEIGRQVVAEPRALWAVSALLAALGLAPALPAAPFLVLSGLAGAGAHWLTRRGRPAAGPAPARGDGPPAAGADPYAPPAPLVLALASDLLEQARAAESRFVGEGLSALRERLWTELGVRLPPVTIRGEELAPGGWAVLVDEVPVASGRAAVDEIALVAPADEVALVGIASREEREGHGGKAVAVVEARHRDRVASLGPVLDPLDRVLDGAAAALRAQAHHFVGLQEAQALLDGVETAAPALVREVGRQVPPALLAEVLRRLVEEGVSVRPLRTILEAILEAGGSGRGAAALAEACRRALRRHIGHHFAGGEALLALLLDPAAEAAVRETLAGEWPALDPNVAAAMLDALAAEIAGLSRTPVLLTSPDVRRAVRNLVSARFPRLGVLAYEELPPELPVRPVGRVALAA
jgi:type III secretion protein V